MFISIGKFAFYFLVGYTILSLFVLVHFVCSGIPPPKPFAFVPYNWVESVANLYNQYANKQLPWTVYVILAGILMFQIIIAAIAGLPIIIYNLASMTGLLPLAIFGAFLGVFFQACAYMYAIAKLTGRA